MLERIVGFLEREFLNHAVDIVQLGVFNSFLTVEGIARRIAVDGAVTGDEGNRVDFDAHCSCLVVRYSPFI